MRTLVIDDHPEALDELKLFLGSIRAPDGKPYEVSTAHDLAGGIKLLTKRRFDLVITDMRMGGEEDEGLGILRELIMKSPIAIVLTGFPSIPNCVQAMRMGAWDYIEKHRVDGSDPYEKLIESIEAACNHRRKHPETGKAKGDIEWAHNNIEMLIRKYPGKIIAILDQKIVEVGKDTQRVLDRVVTDFPFARPQIIAIPREDTEEA